MQKGPPPTITTEQLRRLVAGGEPLWLVYASGNPRPSAVRIPGSLTTADEDLLASLVPTTPLVVYGNDAHAVRARALASRFMRVGRGARWYAGGLDAWTAAGLPTDGQPGNR